MKKLLVLLFVGILLLPSCQIKDAWTEDFYTKASVGRIHSDGSGGYWHEYPLGAIDLSPGASGSTLITPNASSLGGYQLNGLTEYLFFDSHIDHDWDRISNGKIELFFEVNDDNSGGLVTDTVKFQLEVWHKIAGERTTTVYSLDSTTIVGQAQQHDLFEQEIDIGNLRVTDVLAFRLNLNTITGDVTDVIVNYIEFKYQTYLPQMEES